MIVSIAPAMKKNISEPLKWVVKQKLEMLKNKGQAMQLDPVGGGTNEDICNRD